MGSEGEAEEWVPRKDPLLWRASGRLFESYLSGISQVRKQVVTSRSSVLGQLCAVNTQALVPVRRTMTSGLEPFSPLSADASVNPCRDKV